MFVYRVGKGCGNSPLRTGVLVISPRWTIPAPKVTSLNARGGLAIPPFIEPHIHLDTTQTAGEPNWNQSGTLFEGIERWAERKALLSHEM
jgi:cytosine deaminase